MFSIRVKVFTENAILVIFVSSAVPNKPRAVKKVRLRSDYRFTKDQDVRYVSNVKYVKQSALLLNRARRSNKMQIKTKQARKKKDEKSKWSTNSKEKEGPSLCAHTLVLLIIYTAVHFYNAE